MHLTEGGPDLGWFSAKGPGFESPWGCSLQAGFVSTDVGLLPLNRRDGIQFETATAALP